MNATGSMPAMFRDIKDIVGSHIFLPVEAVDGDILPCIHVLCRSCIETVSSRTGKKSEDKMICAVCELEFEVPSTEALHKLKPMEELLLELSKAANDIKPLCENSCTWNEVNSRSASTYCTVCKKFACFPCADKQHKDHHHQSVEKRSHWTQIPPNFGFCVNHKWHVKQLEVFCIVCYKVDCFMRFVENLPYGIKDCDKKLAYVIQSFNDLSTDFRAISIQVEKQIQLESWKKEKEKKIEVRYKEMTKTAGNHKDWILDQLKSVSAQVIKDLEQKIGQGTMHFDSPTTEHETQIETIYEGPIKAIIEGHRKSLLDQLKSVNTEVKEELEKKKGIIDALLNTVESYRRSCVSMQSRGKTEEKFCAVGAILKKAEELKTELNFWREKRNPTTLDESPDLKKSFKSEMQRKNQEQSDNTATDADNKRKKGEKTNETIRYLYESGHQGPSSVRVDSRERSKDASDTFEMLATVGQSNEDRKITFPEALLKYKGMLEQLKNQIIPYKIRTKDKRWSPLLKKEEAEKLRQQFSHVRLNRPDKQETAQWRSIEQLHDKLIKLACTEAEGQRFAKIADQVNDTIDDLLKKLDALEIRYQQGLSNFGNTCYFNAVIQCLCQTFPLLEELSSRNTTQHPLTESFVEFWNHRCIGSPEQNEAFSKFFEQLFTSSPKFNNYQQHDSHDLFIHFLNDLRSEERLHTTKDPRFNVDPRKILTTVDKVFGGHFITMYECLKCVQPYFVCECLLDISLPICIPKQQQQQQQSYSRGGTYQVTGQRDRGSTVDKRQNLGSYSYQEKESILFLEALNEEQRIPEDEGRRYRTKPVTLTECLRFYTTTEHIPEGYLCLSCQDGNQSAAAVNAQTMPPALKRTLIYNPPAILVLHMKRFERTATGFTKRSDRVSYEELLDLGPYCSSDCLRIDPEDKNVWYSLYGVVVHSGSLECGHYTAYVKIGESKAKVTKTFLQKDFLERDQVAVEQNIKFARSGGKRADQKVEWQPKPATDGKWIYVSDSNTREATSLEALDQEAFMLFYERVPKHGQ